MASLMSGGKAARMVVLQGYSHTRARFTFPRFTLCSALLRMGGSAPKAINVWEDISYHCVPLKVNGDGPFHGLTNPHNASRLVIAPYGFKSGIKERAVAILRIRAVNRRPMDVANAHGEQSRLRTVNVRMRLQPLTEHVATLKASSAHALDLGRKARHLVAGHRRRHCGYSTVVDGSSNTYSAIG